MKVAKSVSMFLAHVQKQHAAKTFEAYSGRLKSFVGMHGSREVKKLSAKHVQKWLDQKVYKKKHAPDTQRAAVVAYTQFQNWLVKRRDIKKPLLTNIYKPTGRRREYTPEPQEFAAILRLANRETARILRCLRYTAARPNELARARIEDYFPDRGVIELKQHKTARKTGKPRVIGIGAQARRIIERAIAGRTSGPIFLNAKEKPWTANSLSHAFRRLRDKAGVCKLFVLYCLRHWTATVICRRDGIEAAREVLGHTSINMTQRYVHPDEKAMAEYQNRAFSRQRAVGLAVAS